jgi:GntR family transcriptional regulator
LPESATTKPKEATPRYLRLAGDLREAILAGSFGEGTAFPTEADLCQRYKVSRFTVREALRRLQAEGLIERKRGSGTRVQPAAARGGALHQPLSNVGEILQYARDSKAVYERIDTGPLPQEIAVQIAGSTKGNWTCFRGIRKHPDDALPIAVTDAYFHERLGSAIDKLDLAGTLFSQIERLSGISIGRVTQDIQAVPAESDIAELLGIDEGGPVLRIVRCYNDPKGELFEISVSYHPGDRFAYSMHIDVES